MTLLVWVGFGVLFGWLAGRIRQAETGRSRWSHLAIGVIGAVGGGLLSAIFSNDPQPYHLWNLDHWANAVMGSSLLLFIAGQRSS